MKRKNISGILQKGFASLLAASSIFTSFSLQEVYAHSSPASNINPAAKQATTTQSATTQSSQKNEELIKGYIKRFLTEYVSSMSAKPGQFRKNVEKRGLEAIISEYEEAEYRCLELAEKIYNSKENVNLRTNGEYDKIADFLVKQQQEFSEGIANCNTESVRKANINWARIKTKHRLRLLEAKGNFKTYENLARKAYTKKEYQEYVEEQNKANDALYDSIYNEIPWYIKLGSFVLLRNLARELQEMKKPTRQAYDRSIGEIYP